MLTIQSFIAMKNILLCQCSGCVVCLRFLQGKHYAHGTYFIVVEKSKFELTVFDDDGWLVKYPVVLAMMTWAIN